MWIRSEWESSSVARARLLPLTLVESTDMTQLGAKMGEVLRYLRPISRRNTPIRLSTFH